MTLYLILLISAISTLAFYQPIWMDRLQFSPYLIFRRKQYYRIVTHALLHANWEHLIVNMIVLFSFGNVVERSFETFFGEASNGYYLLLVLGSIMVSTIWSLIQQKNNPYYRAVGASGAVSAILFTAIFFDPWSNIYFFGILPIPGIIFSGLYLYYSYYMSTRKVDNIGHDAHFLGAIFGFIFPILLKPDLFLLFLQQLVGRIAN